MCDKNVQAFHPCRHATHARIAGQLFDRVATGEVVAMRVLEGGSQFGIRAEPLRHLTHEAGRLEGADRRCGARARQVEEGRKRRPVRQPRLRFDHVGKTALAAVSNAPNGPRSAAKLPFDDDEICRGRSRTRQCGHSPLPEALAAAASLAASDASVEGSVVGNVAGGGATAESDTGADAGANAGEDTCGTRAGASDGVGEGNGFGVTPLAALTDAHNWPYHGCEASAAAALASGAGVGVSVTYGTWPGNT